MDNKNLTRFSGYCSVAAGISYIIAGITYFLMPINQRSNTAELHDFYTSISQNSDIFQFHYWSFSFAAFFGISVVITTNRLFKSINEEIVNWVSLIALIGYSVMFVDFVRMANQIPYRAQMYIYSSEDLKLAMLGANSLTLDPMGIVRFGFIGFWFLVINYIVISKNKFPFSLACIGIIVGVLHIFVAIGQVFENSLLFSFFSVTVAAGMGGMIFGPLWFFWFGNLINKIDLN